MADTAQFPPGEMLDEKYRIDQLLSVGGMGAVYVGTHTLLRKRVAIKVLRRELAGSTAMIERFQREAVAASAIGHENIVSVTDMGTTAGGVAFLVMELLEGRSLAHAIRTDGPLPVAAACDVASEILSGVQAAHGAGIVHRDLKPENVFLVRRASGKGEAVKILDFGISSIGRQATPEPRLTITGIVMGTPSYMAPEQARGDKDITFAADIYSVGVILYEMLTKQIPYEAENYNMVMYRVLSGEHVPLVMRRPELGQKLSDLVEKAMALKPRDRFASAEAFEAALAPYCTAGPASGSVRVPTTGQQRAAASTSPGTPPPIGAPPRELSNAETLAASQEEMAGALRTPGSGSLAVSASAVSSKADTRPRGAGAGRSRMSWIVGGVLLGVGAIAAFAFGMSRGKPPVGVAPVPVAAPALVPAEPVVPAAPAGPAAPTPVVLEFAVDAPGAFVTVDGARIDGLRFETPPSKTLRRIRVEAPGYQASELLLSADHSTVVPVTLAKVAAAPETPPRRRRGERTPATPTPPVATTPPVTTPPSQIPPPVEGEKKPRNSRIVTDSPYATPGQP